MATQVFAPLAIRGMDVMEYLFEGGSWFEADEVVWKFQLKTAQTDAERHEALVGLGRKSSGIYERVLAAAALEPELEEEGPESESLVKQWQDHRSQSQSQSQGYHGYQNQNQNQSYHRHQNQGYQNQRSYPQRPYAKRPYEENNWQPTAPLMFKKPMPVALLQKPKKNQISFSVLADSDSE